MSISLSRAYTCRYGSPTVDKVDPRIFQLRYFAYCMDCTFCKDACCQYGVDIEMPRVAALEKHQKDLEAYIGVPRSEWFREDPDDHGILEEPEYPGGEYTRTKVAKLPEGRSPHNSEACVFVDPQGRGCRIHRYALERGIPVPDIKPMICMMFPVLWAHRELIPAIEFDEENGLVCAKQGPTLYRAARSDIEYYFCKELVEDLDRIEATIDPATVELESKTIPLPVRS